MTVETERPDADISISNCAYSGGGNYTWLADDSINTYVFHDYLDHGSPAYMKLGYSTPTIPGTSKLKEVRLRMRIQNSSTNGNCRVYDAWVGNSNLKYATGFFRYWNMTMIEVFRRPISELPATEELAFNVQDTDGYFWVHWDEVYIDFVHVTPPEAIVYSPTGTITTTNRPETAWQVDPDPDGGPQTRYEVKVFDDATYGGGGFDPDTSAPTIESGIQAGAATNWTPEESLPNDTYRAYVRIAQTVNGELWWGSWSYSGFVLNVPTPATPTLTVTPEDASGRIRLELAAGVGGAVSTTDFQVERSYDETNWEEIRTILGEGVVWNTDTTIYDCETPNAEIAHYRARARHTFDNGEISVSAWTATDSAYWTSNDFWIKHPTNPSLNLKINKLASYPGKSTAARQGVIQPLGAALPISVSDIRGGPTGTIKIRFDTDEEREAFDAMLATPTPLLLQLRIGDHEPDRWIAINEQTRARYVDAAWGEKTADQLDWAEVEYPIGNITTWPEAEGGEAAEEDQILV